MKARTVLVLLVGGALSATALTWALLPESPQVSVARVTVGRFEQGIDEEGRTRVRERYRITMPVTGRVPRLSWREGDTVTAGAALTTLWPSWPALQDARTRAELQARAAAADANLARANSRVAQTELSAQQAQRQARRSSTLTQSGYLSPSQGEADRLALASALQDLARAQHERRQAYFERAQIQANLSTYSASGPAQDRPPMRVLAPITGRVLKVLQPDEAMLLAGAALLELGDTTQLEVVAELLTTDALRVAPGQAARITGWGTPEPIYGTVRNIEPSAFTKISALGVEEQRVRVLIDLDQPLPPRAARLGDGFRVALRILHDIQPRAVLVPAGAVFPWPASAAQPEAPAWAVFVVEQRRAHLRRVDLGARQDGMAWIKAGLSPAEQVIIYPPTSLRDTQRVRPEALR